MVRFTNCDHLLFNCVSAMDVIFDEHQENNVNVHKGLIPRQRNSSRETVYAKYGWLGMNDSIEFSLREQNIRFASE